MKKLLIIAAIALSCAFIGKSQTSAQVANFSYTGVPATVNAGLSFTFDITSTSQLEAPLRMWLFFPTGCIKCRPQVRRLIFRLRFGIAARSLPPTNDNGSPFQELQSGGAGFYPKFWIRLTGEATGSQTGTDLGAIISINSTVHREPSGTYFIAHITISISGTAAPGTYTDGNTTAATPAVGGRISIINDDLGVTFPIAARNFTVTIIPEPSTFALLAVAAIGLGAMAYRRRSSTLS